MENKGNKREMRQMHDDISLVVQQVFRFCKIKKASNNFIFNQQIARQKFNNCKIFSIAPLWDDHTHEVLRQKSNFRGIEIQPVHNNCTDSTYCNHSHASDNIYASSMDFH